MSNGWFLKVRTTPRYIDATIDSEKPTRLLAVASNKFVSGDGNVTMEFNVGGAGNDMMMSYVPAQRVAEVLVITAPMAQR